MVISIYDVWDDAADLHAGYVDKIISAALSGSIKSPFLRALLETKAETIVKGTPDQLRTLVQRVEASLKTMPAGARTLFRDESAIVFDYSKFSKKSTAGWNAYELCKASKYILCPYCQQSYAFTVRKVKGGAFRPTLDHYFPKSRYPYLALSLYNLVPSCYTCNSSLKSTKNFYSNRHLHPLWDAEDVKFGLTADCLANWRNTGKMDMKLNIDKSRNAKVEKTIETFLLRERFAVNESMLNTYLEAVELWPPERIEEIRRKAGLLYFSERIALNFDVANYRNEVLGKIRKDLYELMRAHQVKR